MDDFESVSRHCRVAGLLVVAACLLGVAPASAQDWAEKMFDHRSHDFGVVARGAKVEHAFTIENIYEEDAHVSSIRSSCGCTQPKLSKHHLKTWETAELTVAVDTRSFLGRKDATLTVVFDQPFPAEVQLQVHTYIRSDVVVQPGAVQFNGVSQGDGCERQLTISYAGRDDWRIEEIHCTNPHIDTTLWELERSLGHVSYRLSVRLKPDTPVGYVSDTLTLITNDQNPRAARVPIAVEGMIRSAITVRPSPLMLGVLQPGQSVTRKLIVHGQQPFQVTSVESGDPRVKASCDHQTKAVHVIPVEFTATEGEGQVASKLRITTDLGDTDAMEVDVQAMVVGGG